MIFATLVTSNCAPNGVVFTEAALNEIVSDLKTGNIPVLHQWSYYETMGKIVDASVKNGEISVKIDPVDPDYMLYPASYSIIGDGKTKDNKVESFSVSAIIRSSEGF